MSGLSITRTFITSVRKDDEAQPFVGRLYNDLRGFRYDSWIDKTNTLSRGRSLPCEAEKRLQVCGRVFAVMGAEAIASEACLAQRVFASTASKVVTAALRLADYKVLPPEFSQYFLPHFRVSRAYPVAVQFIIETHCKPEEWHRQREGSYNG